jgi:hypothetical protein
MWEIEQANCSREHFLTCKTAVDCSSDIRYTIRMQKTLQNISQIAFFFFLIFGLFHISAAFLVAQQVINKPDLIIFKSLDLPFLFAALSFGTSRLSLRLGSIFGGEKVTFIILSTLSIILFSFALYLNFFLPDANLG